MNFKYRQITIQQLECLLHIAEEGSFSRAAARMNLTQPSMTKHIQNLEGLIGNSLVTRQGPGVGLTREGKLLYGYARRLFRLLGEAEEKMKSLSRSDRGTVFISASTIPATYILPRALNALRREHEGIECRVTMNDSGTTLNRILDDGAEIGFVGRHVVNRKLVAEPLWRDRLILVVPSAHRWYGRERVSWQELLEEPFVTRERGSATRVTIEEYMERERSLVSKDLSISAELGSSEAVKEAVLAGLGVSVLSAQAVRREIEAGLLGEVPLGESSLERNFYLIYKKQLGMQRHHRLFLEFIRHFSFSADGE